MHPALSAVPSAVLALSSLIVGGIDLTSPFCKEATLTSLLTHVLTSRRAWRSLGG